MSVSEYSLKEPLSAHTSNKNDPGWDIPDATRASQPSRFRLGGSATGWALSDRIDRLLPAHKRYLGRSRRTFLIGVAVIIIILVGLIIGLSVGLTQKKCFLSASLTLANR
ncbi:hypothetical protein K491DRAFT_132004 [Lophiostoma macrostomum CBS 122681]|uniref:Uncharacterized protein n=1 Tax=Lophiostoma macrostomum CBS 122681 TaxID=1314788 RepID=A0A6A6STV4_9PLEO|nr:hypothetical protein K491DRAFT_132004 [Lophiostoma macrostomum CBS 122681]